MFEKHISEFHCHLNGSFSLSFLQQTAVKHNRLEEWDALIKTRADYLQLTSQQPESGFAPELIAMVWKQFGLIHQIIQDLDDIEKGTLDVVKNSQAKYVEIRTTPKPIADETRERYIQAFERGIVLANAMHPEKKAVGLLSLDRTFHTAEDARQFIEYIKASPHKALGGIDISGNFMASRTLTGEALYAVINMVLENGLAIAIHMGEADIEQERLDTDTVLSALEHWKSQQPSQDTNPLHGRIRLGHCIFLTETQKERIRHLKAPIEVCPSCHSKMNWHVGTNPHPATSIYSDISDPIVPGTDDETIFGAGIKNEFNRLLNFFGNKHSLLRKELKEHQSQFRFSP